MRQDQLKHEYDEFFSKSEAGKYFISYIEEFIASQHTKSENNPELSRDYAQSAKGAREVLNHIRNIGIELVKGKYKK